MSTPSPDNSSNRIDVISSAMLGAMMGAAGVLAFVSKGKLSTQATAAAQQASAAATQQQTETALATLLEQSITRLRSNIQTDIIREVNQGTLQTTSLFSSSFQTQEREIGKNLQPVVSVVPNELQRIHARLSDLNAIFRSNTARGTFGELQLEALVKDNFAMGSFEFQCTIKSNNKRVDCMLFLPEPIGRLAIDSKFPLDAFREQSFDTTATNNGVDDNQTANSNNSTNSTKTNTKPQQQRQQKQQKDSLKKHISDIATKYIVPGETADYAVMFLPSQSLFLQVVENHPDILLEAHRKSVWIACPTTLLAVLNTLRGVTRNITLHEGVEEAVNGMQRLLGDVDRLVKRHEDVEKGLEKAREQVRLMNVSIDKIRRGRDALQNLGMFDPDAVVSTPVKKTKRRSSTAAASSTTSSTVTDKKEETGVILPPSSSLNEKKIS